MDQCPKSHIKFPFTQCCKTMKHENFQEGEDFHCKSTAGFLLMQFFLFDLQLQHNGVELHVQIVGSLKFPLVVLPDVQRMSASRGNWDGHYYIFLLLS